MFMMKVCTSKMPVESDNGNGATRCYHFGGLQYVPEACSIVCEM